MDTSYNQRNREQTERLKTLSRLTDAELARPMGEHWTVAVALAHLAYYDARVLSTLDASLRHGVPRYWWNGPEALAVNDARLDGWRALSPRETLDQAIQIAEAVDRFIATLPDDFAETILDERPSALDRSRHRAEHLDEVDAALT